ncbi:hypothetical protein PS662_00579 [Pseudomonas fluorescens]|uniref:Uncharacterized protein n=1 Tax=Pseudomonas fluorescens TaxID=294 RepID=A0A5E6PXG1_PSEFL|nr:hypothetical protein [Pseudomonas fluorescens]VVM46950.1 hypothetical protein PS662_00579 [Pseudomonas fluorescens]
MLINIASLRQPTFTPQFSYLRAPRQSITDYVTSELDMRVAYVRRKLEVAALAAREKFPGAACLFFTLPEFFWNIPWREVDSEEELNELTTAYLEKVPACVRLLMTDLPVEHYGKIVLLAGSCATLIKVGEGERSYYDVINYLLAMTNKEYEVDIPLMSMWPKRHVSAIDFGEHESAENGFLTFQLSSEVRVKVKALSSVQAEHSYFGGYGQTFVNSLAPECPFGINLCLDYMVQEDGERDSEIEITAAKIDFLIACGMPFNYFKRHQSSIQFAIRNDGMGRGECEVVRVEEGEIADEVPSEVIDHNLYLVSIDVA